MWKLIAWLQEVDYVCKHWDENQLNPIYLCDIVFISLLPSASASGNKNDVTLVLEFNYTIWTPYNWLNKGYSFYMPAVVIGGGYHNIAAII